MQARKGSFRNEFKNKILYTWSDKVGPPNEDKVNFITLWMVEHGWEIKTQYSGVASLDADDDNFITH